MFDLLNDGIPNEQYNVIIVCVDFRMAFVDVFFSMYSRKALSNAFMSTLTFLA